VLIEQKKLVLIELARHYVHGQKMVRPDQNHSARRFSPAYEESGVASPKGCRLYEASPGVLRASMKLIQQRWTGSERRKDPTTSIHIYEVRPRADKQGFDLISDALQYSSLWYGGPNAVRDAIGYTKFRNRSKDAVIRVYDAAGNVIATHERKGESKRR
jgi:hypothetical protein